MAFGDKPTALPEWADGGGADISEPLLAQKQSGYVDGQVPDAGELNWWMNLTFDWVGYLWNFENVAHDWAATQTFSGIASVTNDLQVQDTAFLEMMSGSLLNLYGTAAMTFSGTSSAKWTTGASARFDDGSTLHIGHGTGATGTALLSVEQGGSIFLTNKGGGMFMFPSTGTDAPGVISMTSVGDGAYSHVPRIQFGGENQLQLNPALGIPAGVAGFRVSDGAFSAGVGFYTAGFVFGGDGVVAGEAVGFELDSARTSYRHTAAHEMTGSCGAALANVIRVQDLNSPVNVSGIGGTQISGNPATVFVPIHAPAGATIDKIQLDIVNGTGNALTGTDLLARIVTESASDETSVLAVAYKNTSGVSGDGIAVAAGAARTWYAIPMAGFVVPSNGIVYLKLSFSGAAPALSDLFQIYGSRARVKWTVVDAQS